MYSSNFTASVFILRMLSLNMLICVQVSYFVRRFMHNAVVFIHLILDLVTSKIKKKYLAHLFKESFSLMLNYPLSCAPFV